MCKQSSTSLSKKQHTRGKTTLSSCTDLFLDLKTVPPHTYLSGHFWHSQVAATNKREGIKNTLTSLHNSTSEETPSERTCPALQEEQIRPRSSMWRHLLQNMCRIKSVFSGAHFLLQCWQERTEFSDCC